MLRKNAAMFSLGQNAPYIVELKKGRALRYAFPGGAWERGKTNTFFEMR